MNTSIRAVLWDFGGVLTTSPFAAFRIYEQENGLPDNFIRSINATNPENNAWAAFESNQIDADEFDQQFAKESSAAGYRVQGRDVIALLKGEIRPNMVRALETCKQHYSVACITNNVKPQTKQQPSAAVASTMALFDLVVESSLEGIRKPDPEIYRLACVRLSVEPTSCVFLDDLGINLKPAKALGMQTIKVVDEHQALSELQTITGLTF